MFRELFRFELYYRRRRATTYVYFFVIFLTSFITITSPTLSVTGTSDATSANSPYTIAVLMVVLSFVFSLITSSLVGVAVVRDVEHEMAPIIFTTPIHKGSYLFGRFAGSLVILILLNTGIIFGALTGFLIGNFLPREVAWQTKEMLPFNLWSYLQPYLLFSVTNIFITGSIFFAAGALIRKPVVIYSQGVALVMLYQVANIFYLRDLSSQHVAALIDPFGVQTFVYMTRYWTPAEQNTLLVPFEGAMLYNRIIWMSIAVVVLFVTYWRFSFTSRRGFARKKKIIETPDVAPPARPLPKVEKRKGFGASLTQLRSSTWFHFKGIWTEIPFLAIAGTGFIVLLVNSAGMDNMYGTSSYPTTSTVLTMLGSFSLFFSIIVIFYSGETMWKERQYKIHSIIDTAPVSNNLIVLSKFFCLCLVYLSFLGGFFLYGILLQSLQGYYQYDLKAYFGTLSETFINLCLTTIAAMLIQALSRNKFLGFVITVMFVLLISLLPLFGIENEMFAYGSGSLGVFSQMNGFGHFTIPFFWLKSYWSALGILFFVLAVVFYRRTERPSLAIKLVGAVAFLTFIGLGIYIYYNIVTLNHFKSSRKIKAELASYEKDLERYKPIAQPKIVEIDLNLAIYAADRRSFKAVGQYSLTNFDTTGIAELRIQIPALPHIDLYKLEFGRAADLIEDRPDLGHRTYKIDPPLAPGDTIRMRFFIDFIQKGFKSKPQNTDFVYNGTFFRNSYLPAIGFSKPSDFGKEAHRTRFKTTLSTDSGQFVIAPGTLTKDWHENHRHYQQYEVATTMPGAYAILSGKYKIKKDKWNTTDLEIYYDPAHTFNVDRMMQGLKDGLDYYTTNFGSIQAGPIRIVESPRYSTGAASFPGTIAFSESVGFILKVSDPGKDLDVPYYVTAHELAHQWWGQQVTEANTDGQSMLSEGMAQYSALMVMSHTYTPEVLQLFLKYELDAYLKGRTSEKKKELPLVAVRDQQYISYNKSALAFFALQDYIGESNVNKAFRSFYDKWALAGPPYPTSIDLVNEIRKVTPDSVSYLISDMFERITLYENKASEAAYRVLANGRYEITLNVSTEKLQVDNSGKVVPISMNDWIDVGVYGKDEHGKLKLIYLRKHKFSRQRNTLTISVNEQPVKVGIDPLNKLIDHHSNDNVINVGKLIELTN